MVGSAALEGARWGLGNGGRAVSGFWVAGSGGWHGGVGWVVFADLVLEAGKGWWRVFANLALEAGRSPG